MKRQIIKIDREKCNGCGLCVSACHENAIALVDGKATLLRDDFCDGLGDCLPICPTDAIAFEEREALAYDEAAVHMNRTQHAQLPCGCPGTNAKAIQRTDAAPQTAIQEPCITSRLYQWPVQIKLVPVSAPYFKNADILVAADCTAYAYGNFHHTFMRGKITLIGCPKLDTGDYSEKLSAILRENLINSITVVRMEVPCCGGIVRDVKTALQNSGKAIPLRVVTIGTDGSMRIE